ncbi:hypothetical protein EJ02DRAFT_433670 [Clathrospora elynae]|uniref:Uncharacterized protein n=1 Tax=Clathrospora elynae TaxID=706981 RepID=A0A6A5SQB2_9PLEO|nr:hypothetical protein EJ02DRAFT_433670 [Clathrospora elynae]
MGYTFSIPDALTKVQSKLDQPLNVGRALGAMLYYIVPLISTLEELSDVFQALDVKQTRLFNKGVNKALPGVQWVVYPDRNVVVEIGESEDWTIWLRGQCEELGMREARDGKKVLEEMQISPSLNKPCYSALR